MSLFVLELYHASAELHREENLRTRELPRIAVPKPVVGVLYLVAVFDTLVEHAVLIADAIPVSRQAQRGHGIEKAGRKSSKPSIAESCVHLQFTDSVDVQLKVRKRPTALAVKSHIEQAVREQPASEEFHREVVDALGIGPVVAAHGLHPAFDQPLPHSVGRRMEPVAMGGSDRVLAQ